VKDLVTRLESRHFVPNVLLIAASLKLDYARVPPVLHVVFSSSVYFLPADTHAAAAATALLYLSVAVSLSARVLPTTALRHYSLHTHRQVNDFSVCCMLKYIFVYG
jgi:hypothetical protein